MLLRLSKIAIVTSSVSLCVSLLLLASGYALDPSEYYLFDAEYDPTNFPDKTVPKIAASGKPFLPKGPHWIETNGRI